MRLLLLLLGRAQWHRILKQWVLTIDMAETSGFTGTLGRFIVRIDLRQLLRRYNILVHMTDDSFLARRAALLSFFNATCSIYRAHRYKLSQVLRQNLALVTR